MSDRETIEQQVRVAHPEFRVTEDGRDRTVRPADAEYEPMIADRVDAVIERDRHVQREADDQTRLAQAQAVYDALQAGTATDRQAQAAIAFLLRREARRMGVELS
jgi:hypothetical protein